MQGTLCVLLSSHHGHQQGTRTSLFTTLQASSRAAASCSSTPRSWPPYRSACGTTTTLAISFRRSTSTSSWTASSWHAARPSRAVGIHHLSATSQTGPQRHTLTHPAAQAEVFLQFGVGYTSRDLEYIDDPRKVAWRYFSGPLLFWSEASTALAPCRSGCLRHPCAPTNAFGPGSAQV